MEDGLILFLFGAYCLGILSAFVFFFLVASYGGKMRVKRERDERMAKIKAAADAYQAGLKDGGAYRDSIAQESAHIEGFFKGMGDSELSKE